MYSISPTKVFKAAALPDGLASNIQVHCGKRGLVDKTVTYRVPGGSAGTGEAQFGKHALFPPGFTGKKGSKTASLNPTTTMTETSVNNALIRVEKFLSKEHGWNFRDTKLRGSGTYLCWHDFLEWKSRRARCS